MATILVVDDYAVTQRMLSFTLQKQGHATVTASGGAEALDVLQDHPVDLAILDLAMPEMDGVTLLKRLRADPRFQRLPVIMLTASGEDQDRVAAKVAGANDFLTKPTSSRELTETVNRLLGLPGKGREP